MDKDEQELGSEDEFREENTQNDNDEEILSDAALLDEGVTHDEFVQESVETDDLATGNDATIPIEPADVDEDTQGDEGTETNGEILLTRFEVAGASDVIHGDEVELDLQDALETGRTVDEAPESD